MRSLQQLAEPVLALPRVAKRLLVLLVDASLCVLTVWVAFYLRLDEWVRLSGTGAAQPVWAVLVSLVLALPLFVANGFYRVIFRHSDWHVAKTVFRVFGLYALLYATLVTAVGLPGVPRSVGIIQPMLLLLTVGASRALAHYWLGGAYQAQLLRATLPKVLIYGAGAAGRQLAVALASNAAMRVVGFLDDDPRLQRQVLHGLPIHSPAGLSSLVEQQRIDTVLLALPSVSRARRNEILMQMRRIPVAVRTLPSVTELAQGKVGITDLQELDIDDLLGRDPVPPNQTLLRRNVATKVVLVTGAGGSIGAELCRQIAAIGPATLLLIEQSEFFLYAIHQELEILLAGRPVRLVPLLASVQDRTRMSEIMSAWCPDTVYHAAAYKHVPLVEHNPAEGIRNNVMGTWVTAQQAIAHGVKDFVLISTDKAVRPTNIMGASKRLAEMTLQALADTASGTRFAIVRFGNVLGSSGSVVPKFRQQIREKGPITLTHPDITRYFMTIPEAAQLVIQAGAMSEGGDVFVLDMGPSVRIIDLARRMVELSGLSVRDEKNPYGDIEIRITGLRPGEKLYEELLIGDNPRPTEHPGIMKANEVFLPWTQLEPHLAALMAALQVNDIVAVRRQLRQLVFGYEPNGDIVDWVYMEQAAEVLH